MLNSFVVDFFWLGYSIFLFFAGPIYFTEKGVVANSGTYLCTIVYKMN